MTSEEGRGPRVEHDEEGHRFVARLENEEALLAYDRAGSEFSILHTEVPPAFEGRGVAGELTRAALAYARAERLAVVPLCPFAAVYLKRHPEYLDLVAPAYRERLSRD